MLLKVETTIAAALPEAVWKVFSAEAQQQHGDEDRRREQDKHDKQLRDRHAGQAGDCRHSPKYSLTEGVQA